MAFKLNWKQQAYEKRKHYLASIKIASGCADCGVTGPDEVLSFDHVRGEKSFNIGSRWDVSSTAIAEEIGKCEVVCLNCHAKREMMRKRAARDGLPPFVPFAKISRWSRDIVVTEKLDGTNAVVWVDGDLDVWPGSKNRWLTIEQDNHGFAKWVAENEDAFKESGPGVYRGEWWGQGIQRGYGLTEKRFSLFNVSRWNVENVPACCHVVPVLYTGPNHEYDIRAALTNLRMYGSEAAPGFANPEGVVVYHTASGTLFKKTIEGDEKPKGKVEA